MDRRDIALPADPPTRAVAAEPTFDERAVYAATDQEACRQLTLGIVHEMNNALGGIAVLSEIYQTDGDGNGEGMGLIHKSTKRLQTLVGHLDVLNGPSHGEPTYLNLTDTVRSQFEMFAPLLPKTLRVETTFPAEEMAVHLDEIILRRILLNLLLNLRDDVAGQETAGPLRIAIRHRARSAELTLAIAPSADREENALSPQAQARVADARSLLHGAGGTVIAYSSGGCVLELPLAS